MNVVVRSALIKIGLKEDCSLPKDCIIGHQRKEKEYQKCKKENKPVKIILLLESIGGIMALNKNIKKNAPEMNGHWVFYQEKANPIQLGTKANIFILQKIKN